MELVPSEDKKLNSTGIQKPWQITKNKYVGKDPEVNPPSFVTNILKDAGNGKAGLSVEKITREFIKGVPMKETLVVYRDSTGNPIMVAEITPENKIINLGLDKNRGLLSGKATKSIIDKLEEMGVKDTASWLATSKQGREFMHKIEVRRALSEGKPVPTEVLKDYPELARRITAKTKQPPSAEK
jgi:hypothetical protein